MLSMMGTALNPDEEAQFTAVLYLNMRKLACNLALDMRFALFAAILSSVSLLNLL